MYRAYWALVVIDVGAATIDGWSLLCLNDAFLFHWAWRARISALNQPASSSNGMHRVFHLRRRVKRPFGIQCPRLLRINS
jgi:hypothetical protein